MVTMAESMGNLRFRISDFRLYVVVMDGAVLVGEPGSELEKTRAVSLQARCFTGRGNLLFQQGGPAERRVKSGIASSPAFATQSPSLLATTSTGNGDDHI